MDSNWVLKNARFIFPDQIDKGFLVISHGVIIDFFKDENTFNSSLYKNDVNFMEVDLHGALVGPGFIDVHVHGGGGADVMDADIEAFRKMAKTHGKKGTTRFLLTTVTAPHEDLDEVCNTVKEWMGSLDNYPKDGAKPIGIHLEGPYINTEKKGAQNSAFIRDFTMEEFNIYQKKSAGAIKLITLAPEKLNDLSIITQLHKSGVIVSVGHTDATFEQMKSAFDYGATHMTHLCNAMPSIHHRSPGPITFALKQEGLTADFIADGLHIHPEIIKLILKAKRKQDVIVVTDAIHATGEQNGLYNLGGLNVVVKDGKATLEDGTLAGSCLDMEQAYCFLKDSLNLEITHIFQLMSTNPAKMLGIDGDFGSIEKGNVADLVIIREDKISDVMVDGIWI